MRLKDGSSALRLYSRKQEKRHSIYRCHSFSGSADLAAQARSSWGFTKKYDVHRLVYIELHDTMPAAIQREKQIKEWKRAWKLQLIESANPG